jgi:hypothetical protein
MSGSRGLSGLRACHVPSSVVRWHLHSPPAGDESDASTHHRLPSVAGVAQRRDVVRERARQNGQCVLQPVQ